MQRVRCRLLPFVVLLAFVVAGRLAAQNESSAKPSSSAASAAQGVSITPEQQQLLKATEAFVRDLYAWGPDYKLTLGPLTQSPAADFYNVSRPVVGGDPGTVEQFIQHELNTHAKQ